MEMGLSLRRCLVLPLSLAGLLLAPSALQAAAPSPVTTEAAKPAAAPATTAASPPAASASYPVPDDQPELTLHDSPEDALRAILQRAAKDSGMPPRIVAFGEYHELKGNSGVPSALKRFSTQLLAVLQPDLSDLVLETWVTEGNCGKQETAVVKDVQKTTKRPQTTESELVTLIKQARGLGVQPNILTLTCAEYQGLLDDKGAVDYEKMLKLLGDSLHKKIAQVRLRRAQAGINKIVAVYGGALHNDVFPSDELRPFSFAAATELMFPGQYLEVDLYVPEFIARDASLAKESWFDGYQKLQKPGKTVVVRRGKSSFILLFPRFKR